MPEPLILGFDCSGPWCGAALIRGGRLLAARHESMSKGQAEALLPLLTDILDEACAAWADLNALCVGVGPGNFTGIRIAVAAARGLALARNIPAIGVGACEAAAHDLPRPCRLILPARAGAVYWQDFDAAPLPATPAMPAQSRPEALPPGPPALPPARPVGEAVARIAALRLPLAPLPRPTPLYLRPADAAPPSEAPPVILPG